MIRPMIRSLSFALGMTLIANSSFAAPSQESSRMPFMQTAWTRFLSCERLLKTRGYMSCLKSAMPPGASSIETGKASEFLMLKLEGPNLEECPANVTRRHTAEDLKTYKYACFQVKLSGPSLGGEVEFSPLPKSKNVLRVHKVRYGF